MAETKEITIQCLAEICKTNFNQENFEDLVNGFTGFLGTFCFELTSNKFDADDLFQDICLILYQKFLKKPCPIRTETFVPYCYRIAYHQNIDRLRRIDRSPNFVSFNAIQKNENGEPKEFVDTHSKTPLQELEAIETRSMLAKAIDSLPEIYRISFLLSEFEDLKYKEIGEILNINSSSTIAGRILRAKNLLKTNLKELTKPD